MFRRIIEHIKALNNYSENIGVAFQIKDDILDVESTTEELGKAIGSDAKNKKTTYVSLYGLEEQRQCSTK